MNCNNTLLFSKISSIFEYSQFKQCNVISNDIINQLQDINITYNDDINIEYISTNTTYNIIYNTPCNIEISSNTGFIFDNVKTYIDNINNLSITLNQNTIYLHDYAFSNLSNLTYIHFSDKIQSIPRNCCKNDILLQEVIFPHELIVINNKAFFNCKNINNLYFNNKLRIILWDAFNYCNNLYTVNIPENISIITAAFQCCKQIHNINIPNNIIGIDPYAFTGTSLINLKCNKSTLLKFDATFRRYKYEQMLLKNEQRN